MSKTSNWQFFRDTGERIELAPDSGEIDKYDGAGAAGDIILANNGGNVGVGKVPAEKLDVDGNVAISGTLTVDGVEVTGGGGGGSSMTNSEVKTAYEANADTNAFTDADEAKLDGIEAGADVTPAWVPGSDPAYLTSHQDISGKLDTTGGTITGNTTMNGDLDVSGDLEFTGDNKNILLPDNTVGLNVKQGSDLYMRFDTTNGTEKIEVNKPTSFAGDITLGGGVTVDGRDIAADGAVLDTALQPADISGLASESYVDTEISTLIAAAPAALDTLNELAASLGDDADFAGSMTTALAGKASSAQGALADTALQPGEADVTPAWVPSSDPGYLTSHQDISGKLDTTGGTISGDLTLESTSAKLVFNETDTDPDFQMLANGGQLRIQNETAGANLMIIESGRNRSITRFDAEGGLTVTGNVSVTGTVDGRDIAADGGVLDTALQPGDADLTPAWVPSSDPGYVTTDTNTQLTPAEVRSSLVTASDCNVFTDGHSSKLAGIETGADVTPAWVPESDPSYLTSHQDISGKLDKSTQAGGTAGQYLAKVDGTDHNTQWLDFPSTASGDPTLGRWSLLNSVSLPNSGTLTAINCFGAEDFSSGATWSSDSSGVTIPSDGYYRVEISLKMNDSSTQRATAEGRLLKNGAGEGPRSTQTYIRNNSGSKGVQTMHVTTILDLTAGDVIGFGTRTTGIASSNMVTVADGSKFSLSKLEVGEQGIQGAPGSDGSAGAPGAAGDGFTGGSYDAGTGVVTFTSDDGLGFATGDLRGSDGADGDSYNNVATDGSNNITGVTGNFDVSADFTVGGSFNVDSLTMEGTSPSLTFTDTDSGSTASISGDNGAVTIAGDVVMGDTLKLPVDGQAASPTNGEGLIYFDTTAGNPKFHDGTAWQDFGSGGGGLDLTSGGTIGGNLDVTGTVTSTGRITAGNAMNVGKATEPTSPVTGDLWYDTATNEMKVFVGDSWSIVGLTPQTYSISNAIASAFVTASEAGDSYTYSYGQKVALDNFFTTISSMDADGSVNLDAALRFMYLFGMNEAVSQRNVITPTEVTAGWTNAPTFNNNGTATFDQTGVGSHMELDWNQEDKGMFRYNIHLGVVAVDAPRSNMTAINDYEGSADMSQLKLDTGEWAGRFGHNTNIVNRDETQSGSFVVTREGTITQAACATGTASSPTVDNRSDARGGGTDSSGPLTIGTSSSGASLDGDFALVFGGVGLNSSGAEGIVEEVHKLAIALGATALESTS